MTHADTILRIAVRVAAQGSDRDALRLREIVVWLTAFELRVREYEALTLRLKQCEGERDHIREVELGLRQRTGSNQDPKGKWVK